MTPMEFNEGLAKLKQVYGERHYPDERNQHMFEKVKWLPYRVWMQMVSETIVGHMGQPPSVEKLFEYGAGAIQRFREDEARALDLKISRMSNCSFCQKRGFIPARHVKLNSTYLFACPKCEIAKLINGQNRRPLIPWNEKYSHDYELEHFIGNLKGRRSPWPASIEAVMLQIEDGRYSRFPEKFQSSLKFAKLKESEAWILWDAFFEKRFNDGSVKEILRGQTDHSAISNLTNKNAVPFDENKEIDAERGIQAKAI